MYIYICICTYAYVWFVCVCSVRWFSRRRWPYELHHPRHRTTESLALCLPNCPTNHTGCRTRDLSFLFDTAAVRLRCSLSLPLVLWTTVPAKRAGSHTDRGPNWSLHSAKRLIWASSCQNCVEQLTIDNRDCVFVAVNTVLVARPTSETPCYLFAICTYEYACGACGV